MQDWSNEQNPRPLGTLGLIGLICTLGLGATVLYVLSGPPRLPTSLPSRELVIVTLLGPELPLELVAYVLTTLAWAMWLWMVAAGPGGRDRGAGRDR